MKRLIQMLCVQALCLAIALPAYAQNFAETINLASTAQRDHRVIYEMNVGSFTPAGTFAAAAEQLSELKSLGIDVVWLMPIYPRGGGIDSPYAATNFQKANPAYGTVADLKAFVEKAHSLNMLVWLDWVPNHTATNAEWVRSHPDYYTRQNGNFVHPNNYGDVYELNYGNPELRQAMNDCLKFWIDQADIDGYRCDYVSSRTIPKSYWEETIPMIKGHKAGKVIDMMAECNLPRDRKDLWEVGFDYDYAWAFQTGLDRYGTGVGADQLKTIGNTLIRESSDKQFVRMLYVTNHDQNWNEQKKTLTQKYGDNRYLLSVFANTLYGMPLIYNGQEVGGNQALNYFQDTKINWSDRDNKMWNTLQTLCALKHDVEAMNDRQAPEFLATGNDQVLAYTRTVGTSQMLVLINTATTAQQATLSGLTTGNWTCWLNSETIADRVEQTSASFAASQSFTLEAKGYRIYVTNSATTGISTPQTFTLSKTYSLSGRCMAAGDCSLPKGIYIRNGKKFIVKG